MDRERISGWVAPRNHDEVLVLCVLARSGNGIVGWLVFCVGSIIAYVFPVANKYMSDTDRFSQLILNQLEKINDNQEAVRSEIHTVGKAVQQIQLDNDRTKEKLKDMDEEIKLLSLQVAANQNKLRQLEPVLAISSTVKQIIIKGIGMGIIAVLLWYFTTQLNVKLPWKE